MTQTPSWSNPSLSYPYLAISRHFGVPYRLVLLAADLDNSAANVGDIISLRREIDALDLGTDWQRATARAVAEFRKVQAMGIGSYLEFRRVHPS